MSNGGSGTLIIASSHINYLAKEGPNYICIAATMTMRKQAFSHDTNATFRLNKNNLAKWGPSMMDDKTHGCPNLRGPDQVQCLEQDHWVMFSGSFFIDLNKIHHEFKLIVVALIFLFAYFIFLILQLLSFN